MTSAPGASVAWTIVIGVCVIPGPSWPPSSPAMTRSRAPPSGEVSSWTLPLRMSWYLGAIILSLAGRFTHSWSPWNSPPDITSCSGGASMCSRPEPAVIHWVSPLVMVPPPPLESWWSKIPSTM
ncbi:hypothetical protein STENM223S_00964 [Streptomyces tendae]